MSASQNLIIPIISSAERNLTTSLLTVFGSTLLLYFLGLITYRLFFCPLAKFPGPKLAGATYWYEVYFDLFANGGEGGQLTRHIKRLHDQYGPIVRITPGELHLDDPDYHSEVYCASTTSRPMDKSLKFKYRFGIPDATFTPRMLSNTENDVLHLTHFSLSNVSEACITNYPKLPSESLIVWKLNMPELTESSTLVICGRP